MGFKVGDKVRCIKEDNQFPGRHQVSFGKVYTVTRTGGHNNNFINVINDSSGESFFHDSRFELVNEITKPAATMLTIRVAKKLHCDVEFLEVGSNYMLLRFMSLEFAKVSPAKRCEVILDTFKQMAPNVIANYEILLDAFTPNEIYWLG